MKIEIPEGYALVSSAYADGDGAGVVTKTLQIKSILGFDSTKEAKQMLDKLEDSNNNPLLLSDEQCLKLQDAGWFLWVESWEERTQREEQEKEEQERRIRLEKAEEWYETLSEADQKMVDILLDDRSYGYAVAVD